MESSTVTALVGLILALVLSRSLCRGVYFNPLLAFFGVWTVTLLLYEADRYIGIFASGVSAPADLLLSVSFAAFFAGALSGLTPLASRPPCPLVMDQRVLALLAQATRALFPIFALGVLWKFAVVTMQYGFFFQNLPGVRDAVSSGDLTLPFVSRAMTLLGYIVILNLAVLLAFRRTMRHLGAALLTLGLLFVNDATVAMRGSMFNATLLLVSTFLLVYAVRAGRLGFRHIIGAAVILVGVVLLMTVTLYLRSGTPVTFLERALIDNYVYLAGTVPAMSYFVDHPWPVVLPAQWTFAGLYQLGGFVLDLPSDAFVTQYAPVLAQGPYNSTAFLTYFHSDGREIGVVFFSAVLGFLSAYWFVAAVRRRTVRDLQVAGLLMSLLLFTVRGLMTNGIMFWATWAMLALQHRVIVWRLGARRLGGVRRPTMAKA